MAAVAAVFVVLEGAFRIADLFDSNRGLKNSMGSFNEKYSHAFKPDTSFRLVSSKKGEYDVGIRINNFGFRGNDFTMDKKPGTVRIMAIGDSFIFGVGANDNETIPALIESGLKKKGVNAEVINAGFGNYSTALHYLRLRDEYLEFKPDIVLLFYDFSDLSDDWRSERAFIYDKSGKILRCDSTYVNGKRDWWITARRYSKLCSYIHNKLIRTVQKIHVLGLKNYIKAKLSGKRAKSLIVAQENAFDPVEYDGYLIIRGRERLPYIREHFKRSEKYIKRIKEMLDERNIPMILVIYPYGIHVGPDQWGEGRTYWGFDRGKVYDDYYAFDMLEDCAKRNDIHCINLLPAFLKSSDKKLFFDVDGHFTPEADRVSAGAVISDEVLIEKLRRFVYN